MLPGHNLSYIIREGARSHNQVTKLHLSLIARADTRHGRKIGRAFFKNRPDKQASFYRACLHLPRNAYGKRLPLFVLYRGLAIHSRTSAHPWLEGDAAQPLDLPDADLRLFCQGAKKTDIEVSNSARMRKLLAWYRLCHISFKWFALGRLYFK